MGLDNGFICKNIKRDEIPSWVELPWDLKDKDIEYVYNADGIVTYEELEDIKEKKMIYFKPK